MTEDLDDLDEKIDALHFTEEDFKDNNKKPSFANKVKIC